jgi:hypothetical protein
MKIEEAIVGIRVKSLVEFCNIPKGTEGIIDSDYETGVIVAWDLPDRPLPKEYMGISSIYPKQPLRNGFDKETELCWLEVVNS